MDGYPGFDTFALGAGPGGMDEAARLIGAPVSILGFDISDDAIATATAAGHARVRADMRDLDETALNGATGAIITCPCPTFSASGKGSGRGSDYQHLLDAITCLGADHCGHECDEECADFGCEHTRYHGEGSCECWREIDDQVADPRTALVAHGIRLLLRVESLEWFVLEQVPALEACWYDVVAELAGAGWETFDVVMLDAADFGAGARRRRAFCYGRRYTPSMVSPYGDVERVSAAAVLGWEPGHVVRTRNNRRPGGGNDFSTDGPSWCLTGKARSWFRLADGLRLDVADAGALQGFPRDYPWSGSRTSAFQQAGDVVSPLSGAAVLGAALGIEWRDAVAARSAELAAGPARVLAA